jgi:hypothetical protein
MQIINDATPDRDLFHPGKGRGLDLSDRPRGRAYEGVAQPFPDELLIPRSDWQAIIQEQEEQESRLIDICDRAGLKVKDQQQTSYCWVNGPTHCTEIVRLLQNQPMVSLSPASAGAQITGYRNEGGWGKTALEFILSNGLVPSDKWPDNAIDRRYATAENLALAKKYRDDEWFELEPGNLDQLGSAVLRRIPVAVGYNWWSHEVSAVALKMVDGEPALIIDNSWGQSYGTKGRGVIQGRRMLPDDAVAPRTAIAS